MHVRTLEDRQAEEAASRVAENRCLVAWIRAEANERGERYRYALERLAIEAPMRQAIEVERALTSFGPVVATLDTLPVGALEACSDVVEAPRPPVGVLPAAIPSGDAPVRKD